MGQIGEIIAATGGLALLNAERLLARVTPQSFARLARPGGVTVHSNHPAFVFGHLSLYPQRVLHAVGQPPGSAAAPAEYGPLFAAGAECHDDPDGTRYPPMAALTEFFFQSTRAAVAAVRAAPDAAFTRANPAEGRMRELLPTVGAAVSFYLSGHVHTHLGQISAWRRAMGLPPA